MPKNYKYYNPLKFNVNAYSPALWLDASDRSTLIMDGARTFASTSSQYFSCADNATLRLGSGDIWWSFWGYIPILSPARFIFSKDNSSGIGEYFFYIRQNGSNYNPELSLSYSPTGYVYCASTVNLTASTWFHAFCCYNSSTKIASISINGSAFNTLDLSAYTLNTTSSHPFWVMRHPNGGSYSSGNLDSFCFGKPASGWLTSNATALRDYLYNGGSGRRSSDFLTSGWYTGSNPSGAVSWWDMDARSGNEPDRIGSNNLTDNGGVGYATGIASGLVQYNGDPITRWQDKSGNTRHVTAASDAGRPTYVTGVQNSLPGIRFDRVNDYLTCASGIGVGGLAGYTEFGVLSYSASGNQLAINAANNIISFQGNGTTVAEFVYAGAGNYGSWAFSAPAKIITHIYDGSQTGNANRLKAFVDGTQKTLSFTGTIPATLAASTSFTLGIADSDKTTAPFGGDWLELIVVPSVLDSTAIIAFQRYLGNKWGITVA